MLEEDPDALGDAGARRVSDPDDTRGSSRANIGYPPFKQPPGGQNLRGRQAAASLKQRS